MNWYANNLTLRPELFVDLAWGVIRFLVVLAVFALLAEITLRK